MANSSTKPEAGGGEDFQQSTKSTKIAFGIIPTQKPYHWHQWPGDSGAQTGGFGRQNKKEVEQ
jgi:hypothetical protein